MEELEEYFRSLIQQHKSIDIAEDEFRKAVAEDDELHEQYSEWCHIVGSSERRGFRDFCEEYMDNIDSVWNSLTDYDE